MGMVTHGRVAGLCGVQALRDRPVLPIAPGSGARAPAPRGAGGRWGRSQTPCRPSHSPARHTPRGGSPGSPRSPPFRPRGRQSPGGSRRAGKELAAGLRTGRRPQRATSFPKPRNSRVSRPLLAAPTTDPAAAAVTQGTSSRTGRPSVNLVAAGGCIATPSLGETKWRRGAASEGTQVPEGRSGFLSPGLGCAGHFSFIRVFLDLRTSTRPEKVRSDSSNFLFFIFERERGESARAGACGRQREEERPAGRRLDPQVPGLADGARLQTQV